MAGWTTVDDFETGSIGVAWSGDTTLFQVVAEATLEGDDLLKVDETSWSLDTWYTMLNTREISRNSDGDKTARCLLYCDEHGDKDPTSNGLIFSATDDDNYYIVYAYMDKLSSYNRAYLDKVVSGVRTNLASSTTDNGLIKGIEIKCETNLITCYFYSDTGFSTSSGFTLSTSDTTFDEGYVGVGFEANASTIESDVAWDYIQWYDAGAAPAGWANKIYGVVPGKVEGVAVADIEKVQGVS